MTPNLFVFGPERSGTTLLSFLLSGQNGSFVINDSFIFDRFIKDFIYYYPRIFSFSTQINTNINKSRELLNYILKKGLSPKFLKFPDELPYLQHKEKFEKLDFNHKLRKKDALIFLKILNSFYSNRKDKWISQYANYIKFDDILNEKKDIEIQILIDNTLNQIKEKFKKEELQLLGEKTPLHTLYGKEILKKYKHAKGLLLVKNPIDNVSSIYRRCNNFKEALNRYRVYLSAILELNRDTKVYTLIYDELITNTYESLKKIYGCVGVNLDIDRNLPVYNYIKGSYTGSNIDPERLKKTETILSDKQKQIVYLNFKELFDTFNFKIK